jgi:hypothetical protein
VERAAIKLQNLFSKNDTIKEVKKIETLSLWQDFFRGLFGDWKQK